MRTALGRLLVLVPLAAGGFVLSLGARAAFGGTISTDWGARITIQPFRASGRNIEVHLPSRVREAAADSAPSPSAPAPAPPAPQASPEKTEAQRRMQYWFDQGRAAVQRKDWDRAETCFLRALEGNDNEDLRDALRRVQTCKAYEKHLAAIAAEKNRSLLDMADSLRALSDALADVKSSVAGSRIARGLLAGDPVELGTAPILTDASVVDLRHVRTGVVALQRLQSPYVQPPPPVAPGPQRRLTEDQMAVLGTLLVNYEMGMGTLSLREIEVVLGLPSLEPSDRAAPGASLVPREESVLIRAQLDRFRTNLRDACGRAVGQTVVELQEHPVVRRVRAEASMKGAAGLDPALRALFDEVNREAEQRLFVRFQIVQEMALKELATSCTAIFERNKTRPARTSGKGR